MKNRCPQCNKWYEGNICGCGYTPSLNEPSIDKSVYQSEAMKRHSKYCVRDGNGYSRHCVVSGCTMPTFQPLKGSWYCYEHYQDAWSGDREYYNTSDKLGSFKARFLRLKDKIAKEV